MIKYEKIIMIIIKDKIKYVYFINYLSTLDQMKLIIKYSIEIDICILFFNAKKKKKEKIKV